MRFPPMLMMILPGLLVAATGVGAGDLATAAFTGNALGLTVLWAVVLGALLKFVLTEGLARWQLATGKTLLAGCIDHLGRPFELLFFVYLVAWSFFVGSALMAACGVTFHALFPLFPEAESAKVVWGIAHSFLGVILVMLGGFRFFERVMAGCIVVMFGTVLLSAIRLQPDWGDVLGGLLIPRVPEMNGEAIGWTIALMGGVGGTLTVLCYGYWIREHGRDSPEALRETRIDLIVGYGMTALFGIAMVIIGSGITLPVDGKGAGLIAALGDHLGTALGPGGRMVFLVGAWAAMFSSLLGVWQSVPLIFADFMSHRRANATGTPIPANLSATGLYRAYLLFLAIAPIAALQFGFRDLQKLYAIVGAGFMPFLAAVLLLLNGRGQWIGTAQRNGWLGNAVLGLTLLFFLLLSALDIYRRIGG